MTLLPLVERGLLVGARRGSTYWMRCGAGAVAFMIAAVGLLTLSAFNAVSGGSFLFRTLSWLAWALCLVEGLRHTADCISFERREGTLGLLLLTDLKGWDIALGKLTPALLTTGYTLLAVLPVLGLCLLTGGVTGGEFFRVALALVAALGLSLCTALMVSAQVDDAGSAWAGSIITVALLSPLSGVMLNTAFAAGWSKSANIYLILFGMVTAIAAGMVAVAARSLRQVPLAEIPGVTLETVHVESPVQSGPPPQETVGTTPEAQKPPTAAPSLEDPLPGPSKEQLAARLDLNPAFWLAMRRDIGGPVMLALIGGFLMFIAVLGSLAMSTEGRGAMAFWLGVLTFLAATMVAWDSCRGMADLRRSGMIELMLTTPLTAARVVEGYRKAMIHRFRWAAVAAFAPQTLLLLVVPFHFSGEALGFVLALVGSGCWIVAELYGVGLCALYFGFRSGNPFAAFGRTMLVCVILPGVVLLGGAATCFMAIPALGLLLFKPLIMVSIVSSRLKADFATLAAAPLKGGE